MNKFDLINQIANMKEIDYKNTLAITCIIELLIEKGIIDRFEVAEKAQFLEDKTLSEIKRSNRLEKRADFSL